MDGYSKLVQDVVSVCSTVTRGEIGMFYPRLVHLVDFKGDTIILKNTMDNMSKYPNDHHLGHIVISILIYYACLSCDV
jgi:hypothetical protein